MRQRYWAAWVAYGMFVVAVLASACNPCGKLSKSKALADRDSAAFCYYNRQKWESASIILEELLGIYRGTPRAEVIFYHYAKSKYQAGDYITAGHFFEEFANNFPISPYREEAVYLTGLCLRNRSSESHLDQKESIAAIEKLQYYVELFPQGQYTDQANKDLRDLREKLATKYFNQAALYLKIGKYQAAAIAFRNFLADYPDSQRIPEANAQLVKAQVLFARNSVEEMRRERYVEALAYYQRMADRYPEDKNLKAAESAYQSAQEELKKLK
jgi:outer membrane protein assembly factor BamD